MLFLCNTLYAQQYYWEKASGFPDTGAGAGIEAVTDLEAADGIIRYNGNQYAYENEFVFKRIETLVNNDQTKPGAFFWTGPQGKWIFEEEKNSIYSPVYTLDPATRQLKGMCNLSQYGYYGSVEQSNIVFFKNRYYTLGTLAGNDSREIRVFRRYNASTCQWNEMPIPTNDPRFPLHKLVSDGDNLYVLSDNDMVIFASNDAINWTELQSPASVLNNRGWFPQQKMASDKRGVIILQKMEEDYITGVNLSRFFILKDQTFTQLAMGGDQPKAGYWGGLKIFDSGNLFSLSFDKKELMKSTDKGNSWIKIATAKVPEDINDYIETKDGNIYIGTLSGVYVLKKFKDSAVAGCTDLAYKKKIVNEVRCKKGAATFYMNGGVAPYTIRFQNKLYHTADSLVLSGLQNGYYEIHIQDKNNCYIDTDFYINIDIKKELEVNFPVKDTCSGYYNIVMKYGYPPYVVRWKEGTEQKQRIVEDMSAIYYLTNSVFYLTKEINYQFAVSDQSGCTAVLSPLEAGGVFSPVFTYAGTDNCDSIQITATIPHAQATDGVTFTVRNSAYQIIKIEHSKGGIHTSKVAHNAFYYFELVSDQAQCQSSFGKRFTKPELVALTTKDIYCNGPTDIQGQANLQLLNFNSGEQKIIWSDIGEYNESYRTDLNAGMYSFEIPEETGCGVNRTFEIKKDIPVTTIPEIPFLCPGEIFHLVPTATGNSNPIIFEVWNQNNQYRSLNDGEGIDIINEMPGSYEISALNTTTGCSGLKVRVDIETPEQAPVLQKDLYAFCSMGDEVTLAASSPNAYWYSTSDSKLLGRGVSLLYTTTRPKDSVYVQLQNEDSTCTSLSAFVKLKQRDLLQPQINVVSNTLHTQTLVAVPSQAASSYRWYRDGIAIGVSESLLVENGTLTFIEVEVTDQNGCVTTSEKYYPDFSLDVHALTADRLLTVYPNPATDKLFVDLHETARTGLVHIKDMSGRSIFESYIDQETKEISLAQFAPGIYVVEVQINNQEALRVLVVKQ